MITDSFDNKSKPLITASSFYHEVERNDLICLVTFKKKVVDYVKKHYQAKLYLSYKTTNGMQKVYKFHHQGHDFLIYYSGIGATIASIIMNEVSVQTGAHRFFFFGSSGVLNEEKCRGKIIVPLNSYRDEGISYHYMEPSDTVDIRNGKKVDEMLTKLNIPHISGNIWTTDAIYMETVDKANLHKTNNCLAVEMEVSGVEAVARYLGIDNYHIIFSADSLDGIEWDKKEMGGDIEYINQIKSFEISLKMGLMVYEGK